MTRHYPLRPSLNDDNLKLIDKNESLYPLNQLGPLHQLGLKIKSGNGSEVVFPHMRLQHDF